MDRKTFKKSFFIAYAVLFVISCSSNGSENSGLPVDLVDSSAFQSIGYSTLADSIESEAAFQNEFSVEDDALLAYYRRNIVCEYIGCSRDTNLSDQALELIFEAGDDLTLAAGEITHSPDGKFSILTYEGEGCGAYCNPFWESFMLYKTNGLEKVKRMNYNNVTEIVDLKDGNYLILETSYGRPASTYTVECSFASVIRFKDDKVIEVKAFEGEKSFGYCQEMDVDLGDEHFLYFDRSQFELNFQYGNNYGFSHGLDIDTLRFGHYKYVKGVFELKQERIETTKRE